MSKLIPGEIVLFGLLIIASIVIFRYFQRLKIPGLIGFIAIGTLLNLVDKRYAFFNESLYHTFEFLGNIGIIVLLFRVGLECNISGLLRQLKSASIIWIGNVAVSGLLAYFVLFYLLDVAFFPSLIVAIALTATSPGVSLAVWKEQEAINSRCGELLVDVAELDDISGVMFMGVLFAVLPILKTGSNVSVGALITQTSLLFMVKMVLFASLCLLFSKYLEPRITKVFDNDMEVEPTLIITGISFVIAGLAGFLDLSVAIGAFFAGLIFSWDSKHKEIDNSFTIIYQLFYPFFFINIGLYFDISSMGDSLALGGILIVIATLGKVIGTYFPAILTTDKKESLLLSLSMIPRSEIAMLIIVSGSQLGDWAVPSYVFNAMLVVCIFTSLVPPMILKQLLIKWPVN